MICMKTQSTQKKRNFVWSVVAQIMASGCDAIYFRFSKWMEVSFVCIGYVDGQRRIYSTSLAMIKDDTDSVVEYTEHRPMNT